MHITKTKGDVGLVTIIADLTKQDFNISLPIAEHTRYDLLAERKGQIYRIQVKYRSFNNGIAEFDIYNRWTESRTGRNIKGKHYTLEDIDFIALTDGIDIGYIPIETIETSRVRVCNKEARRFCKLRIEDYRSIS